MTIHSEDNARRRYLRAAKRHTQLCVEIQKATPAACEKLQHSLLDVQRRLIQGFSLGADRGEIERFILHLPNELLADLPDYPLSSSFNDHAVHAFLQKADLERCRLALAKGWSIHDNLPIVVAWAYGHPDREEFVCEEAPLPEPFFHAENAHFWIAWDSYSWGPPSLVARCLRAHVSHHSAHMTTIIHDAVHDCQLSSLRVLLRAGVQLPDKFGFDLCYHPSAIRKEIDAARSSHGQLSIFSEGQDLSAFIAREIESTDPEFTKPIAGRFVDSQNSNPHPRSLPVATRKVFL